MDSTLCRANRESICKLPLHIRNAKGRKDRNVMLSMNLLKTLQEYFKQYRPKVYLFEG